MQYDNQPCVEKYPNIDNSKKQRYLKGLNIFLVILIVLLVVAIIVCKTTLVTITVDGSSMFPTLVDGDRVMLLKRGYTLDRGDIIVFKRQEKYNVKRIIGLAGDVVKFDRINMMWLINGEPYSENYVEGGYSDSYFINSPPQIFHDGVVVPDDHYFVLGDNRNIQGGGVSVDSHIYGAELKTSNILGKVIKVY